MDDELVERVADAMAKRWLDLERGRGDDFVWTELARAAIAATLQEEVTPAMIEAGAKVFTKSAWQIPRANPKAAAECIYTAMRRAATSEGDGE
jgi:hypothetical protein